MECPAHLVSGVTQMGQCLQDALTTCGAQTQTGPSRHPLGLASGVTAGADCRACWWCESPHLTLHLPCCAPPTPLLQRLEHARAPG